MRMRSLLSGLTFIVVLCAGVTTSQPAQAVGVTCSSISPPVSVQPPTDAICGELSSQLNSDPTCGAPVFNHSKETWHDIINGNSYMCYWDQVYWYNNQCQTTVNRYVLGTGCRCPAGFDLTSNYTCTCHGGNEYNGTCATACPAGTHAELKKCVRVTKKSLGPPCPSCGNPINPGTGTKFQDEKVYSGAGTVMLREGYAYNSFSLEDGGFGPPYGRYGVNNVGYYGGSAVDYSAGDLVLIGVSRPDGKVLQFSKPSSGNVYVGDADRAERLEKMVDASNNFIGWRFTSADGEEVELFDTVGRLLSITNRAGLATSLSYADGSGGIMYGSAPNALGYQAPACNAPAGFSHWVASAGAPPQGILLCVTDSFGRQLNYQTDNFQERSIPPVANITTSTTEQAEGVLGVRGRGAARTT